MCATTRTMANSTIIVYQQRSNMFGKGYMLGHLAVLPAFLLPQAASTNGSNAISPFL